MKKKSFLINGAKDMEKHMLLLSGICSTTNLYKKPTNIIAYNGKYENYTNTEMKDIIAYGPVTDVMYA